MWRRDIMMINVQKQPPLVEDLRSHSQEQIAELRQLLVAGAPSRPDPRRPGFYEVEGLSSTYYVFKYPTATKVLLLGVWERDSDPVADLVACSCPAASIPISLLLRASNQKRRWWQPGRFFSLRPDSGRPS